MIHTPDLSAGSGGMGDSSYLPTLIWLLTNFYLVSPTRELVSPGGSPLLQHLHLNLCLTPANDRILWISSTGTKTQSRKSRMYSRLKTSEKHMFTKPIKRTGVIKQEQQPEL